MEVHNKPKVLITGFSKFPGAPVNPSEVLIDWLGRGALDQFDADITLRLLETDYRKVDTFWNEECRDSGLDIAIHFGLSAKAKGFALERIAQNEIAQNSVDVAGYIPDGLEVEAGALAQTTNLPVEKIYERLLELKIPAELSDDAGTYLCNYLFFKSRYGALQDQSSLMSGFVHVPLLDTQLKAMADETMPPDAMTLSLKQMQQGALAVLECCLDARLKEAVL